MTEMKSVPIQYSIDNIKRLTELHIKRFENRISIKKGHPNAPINEHRCEYYLALWKGIAEKGYEWLKLDSTEKNEVMDALDDE